MIALSGAAVTMLIIRLTSFLHTRPSPSPFFPPHPLRAGVGGKRLDVQEMHGRLARQLMEHLDLEALAAWPN